MADEIMRERERITNTFSNMPPPPFGVGNIVVRQPSKRDIYLKQVEPLERIPCLLGCDSVDDYMFSKQYEEASDIDDIQMEEHVIHVYNKTEKACIKWQEGGVEGARVWKEEKGMDVKPWRLCALCKELQRQVRMWTQRFEVKYFHLKREQWGKAKVTEGSVKSMMALAMA